jgi:hypothetical protein
MINSIFNTGIFTTWLNLPRDPEWTTKSLVYLAAGNIFWAILFFVGSHYHPLPSFITKKVGKDDLFHIRYRLICCYHALTATLFAFIWHLVDRDLSCSKRITDFELLMLVNTWTHLVWDLIFMKYYDMLDFGNVMHHMIGIVGYTFTVYSQHNFNVLCINLLSGEITTTAMHVRDIIRRMGWRYTMTFYANDFFYAFGYMFCRSWWLPSAYYWIYPCETINPTVFIMYPIHCIQSWYYVCKLPKMVTMRNWEIKKLERSGLKVQWFIPIHPKKADEIGIKNYEPFEM